MRRDPRPVRNPLPLAATPFAGLFLLLPWDALCMLWGRYPDWHSPWWWASQVACSSVLGVASAVVADAPSHRGATSRVPGTAASPAVAWRLHRLTGRITHVVGRGRRAPAGLHAWRGSHGLDRTAPSPVEEAALRGAQLAAPVHGDPLDDGPHAALRVAYAVMRLHVVSPADAARVARAVQDGGPEAGLAEVRSSLDLRPGTLAGAMGPPGGVGADHAYWESAIVALAVRQGYGRAPLHLLAHLCDAERPTWLALAHVDDHPFHEAAGIVLHARAEAAAGRALVVPRVG